MMKAAKAMPAKKEPMSKKADKSQDKNMMKMMKDKMPKAKKKPMSSY